MNGFSLNLCCYSYTPLRYLYNPLTYSPFLVLSLRLPSCIPLVSPTTHMHPPYNLPPVCLPPFSPWVAALYPNIDGSRRVKSLNLALVQFFFFRTPRGRPLAFTTIRVLYHANEIKVEIIPSLFVSLALFSFLFESLSGASSRVGGIW